MRTTISIPDYLVAQADAFVGSEGISTRNQLIVEAIANWLKTKKEAEIDNDFAMMAEDTDYINETLDIESQFAQSDAEVATLNND